VNSTLPANQEPRPSRQVVTNRHRSHLWEDLDPYVCLERDCPFPETTFNSIRAWLGHDRSMHWRNAWICSQCPQPDNYHISEQAFCDHLRSSHGDCVSEAELSVVARSSREDSTLEACVICGSQEGLGTAEESSLGKYSATRQQNLVACMANHLEALALSSLPWHIGTGNDARSSQAEGSADIENRQTLEDIAMDIRERGFPDVGGITANLATIAQHIE
jgi:hypothetical protein